MNTLAEWLNSLQSRRFLFESEHVDIYCTSLEFFPNEFWEKLDSSTTSPNIRIVLPHISSSLSNSMSSSLKEDGEDGEDIEDGDRTSQGLRYWYKRLFCKTLDNLHLSLNPMTHVYVRIKGRNYDKIIVGSYLHNLPTSESPIWEIPSFGRKAKVYSNQFEQDWSNTIPANEALIRYLITH